MPLLRNLQQVSFLSHSIAAANAAIRERPGSLNLMAAADGIPFCVRQTQRSGLSTRKTRPSDMCELYFVNAYLALSLTSLSITSILYRLTLDLTIPDLDRQRADGRVGRVGAVSEVGDQHWAHFPHGYGFGVQTQGCGVRRVPQPHHDKPPHFGTAFCPSSLRLCRPFPSSSRASVCCRATPQSRPSRQTARWRQRSSNRYVPPSLLSLLGVVCVYPEPQTSFGAAVQMKFSGDMLVFENVYLNHQVVPAASTGKEGGGGVHLLTSSLSPLWVADVIRAKSSTRRITSSWAGAAF